MTDETASERPARPWDLWNKNIGRVTTIVAEERFEICKACPNYVSLTHQCTECGCIMNAKVKLPNASCPIGKWSAVSISYKTDDSQKDQ